jgi:hypothetical protein
MTRNTKKKMGRPTKRTPELEARLLDLLEKGKMLITICEAEDMPGRANIYKWSDEDADFRDRIRLAREKGHDAIAEECLKIADYSALDTLINEKTGNPHADREWIARSRLRVDTRLRLLAKWSPKKYGDKIEVENTGNAPILQFNIGGNVNDPSSSQN